MNNCKNCHFVEPHYLALSRNTIYYCTQLTVCIKPESKKRRLHPINYEVPYDFKCAFWTKNDNNRLTKQQQQMRSFVKKRFNSNIKSKTND